MPTSDRVVWTGVFASALLARVAWLWQWAPFSADPGTSLWMALDAVRGRHIPDHGLVSSLHVFQPPGLVWVIMPWSWLGSGEPRVVMVGLGVMNAVAIACLGLLVFHRLGGRIALAFASIAVCGPDAFNSALIWHPSLFAAAACVLTIAGVRCREGSRVWTAIMLLVPSTYGLIHYSGLAMFAPAGAILLLERRRWRAFVGPGLVAALVSVVLWLPFLRFEYNRHWVDLRAVSSARAGGSRGLGFAVGQGLHGWVPLTPVLLVTVGLVLIAAIIGKVDDPMLLGVVSIWAAGVLYQELTGTGYRHDVFMLWLIPEYLIAAYLIGQPYVPRRLFVAVIVTNVSLGTVGLMRYVTEQPKAERLRSAESQFHTGASLAFDDLFGLGRYYLPCDPPYSLSTGTWYLLERRQAGAGRSAAEAAGAFRARATCTQPLPR